MRQLILLLALLTAVAYAQVETLSVDGIFLNSKASKHAWLPNPCPDGQYTAGKTTVEIKDGKVLRVWGQFLTMGHHTLAQVGWNISELDMTLGPTEKILYGCGTGEGSTVRFYDELGVTVNCSTKVTQVLLAPKL